MFATTVVPVISPGVVPPIVPGAAHVLPKSVEALIVPVLVKFRLAPAPTTIAAVVLVPLVIALKALPAPVPLAAAVIEPSADTVMLALV